MKLFPGQKDDLKQHMSTREKGHLWLGISGTFFLLAITSYLSPTSAPATGRWAWLNNAALGLFGASGNVILYLGLGCAGFVTALAYYRAKKNH